MADEAERAARTMLGDLDEPELEVRAVLDRLFRRIDMLSDGEQVVADLSLQVWNGGGTRTLADAVRWLDEESLKNLMRALAILRPDAVAAAAQFVVE